MSMKLMRPPDGTALSEAPAPADACAMHRQRNARAAIPLSTHFETIELAESARLHDRTAATDVAPFCHDAVSTLSQSNAGVASARRARRSYRRRPDLLQTLHGTRPVPFTESAVMVAGHGDCLCRPD
jgi:hypothetical protein